MTTTQSLQARPAVTLSNGRAGFRALLAAETRVLSEKDGLVEYVASDETCDSHCEIIRAEGWRFSMFAKNSPFVDSHNYNSIENLLGSVVDWRVDKRNRRLVETVKWAKDVPENQLAQIGWAMTQAGHLKAVSVGFDPVRAASAWGQTADEANLWQQQLEELGLKPDANVRRIFVEQEQVELSACILGANPNALQLAAKAYKAGAISDAQIDFLAKTWTSSDPATAAIDPAVAAAALRQAQEQFLTRFEHYINQLKVYARN